jgi:hypothetical protein
MTVSRGESIADVFSVLKINKREISEQFRNADERLQLFHRHAHINELNSL